MWKAEKKVALMDFPSVGHLAVMLVGTLVAYSGSWMVENWDDVMVARKVKSLAVPKASQMVELMVEMLVELMVVCLADLTVVSLDVCLVEKMADRLAEMMAAMRVE